MNVKLLYFLTACLLLALGACDSLIYDDREGSHETDEGPVVYLSITKAQAAGLESLNADAADYEDRVHDLALLVFDSATGEKVGEFHLSLGPFRQVVKDYFQICASYFDAVKRLPPAQIEAIDMARRGIHNEGARTLQERLEGKAEIDIDTARRLFTLICALIQE
mgnify:CR=1 FL=1